MAPPDATWKSTLSLLERACARDEAARNDLFLHGLRRPSVAGPVAVYRSGRATSQARLTGATLRPKDFIPLLEGAGALVLLRQSWDFTTGEMVEREGFVRLRTPCFGEIASCQRRHPAEARAAFRRERRRMAQRKVVETSLTTSAVSAALFPFVLGRTTLRFSAATFEEVLRSVKSAVLRAKLR